MTKQRLYSLLKDSWRLLLILGGCSIFVVLGTWVMLSGNTRWSTAIGGIFAGMGMAVNLIQFFFKLPIEFPRRQRTQESELFLPSPDRQEQLVRLILPLSYERSRMRQQAAQRARRYRLALKGVNLLMVTFPLVALIWAQSHGISVTSSLRKIHPYSAHIQLVQTYCDALGEQDYARAFSYFYRSEGGALVGSQNDPLSESAFANTAHSTDRQQGNVISCSVENEVEMLYFCPKACASSSSYTLTVQIVRHHSTPYLLHMDVQDADLPGSFSDTFIISVDKL